MPRIDSYADEFRDGKTVTVDTGAGTFVFLPPDTDDPNIGPLAGMTAAEAVRVSRVVGGWLRAHALLHGRWHEVFRRRDPGGLTTPERTKVERELAEKRAKLDHASQILVRVGRYAAELRNDKDKDVRIVGADLDDLLTGRWDGTYDD